MKKLYIARHAKSSWKFNQLSDFERPLNKRGKRDAPFMAAIIAKKIETPELLLSSPAERASTTAKEYSKFLKYPSNKIIFDQSIYESSIFSLLKLLSSQDNTISSILIVGHNPCLTELANHLGDKYIDNIPTCGIVGLELDITTWEQIKESCGKQIFFEYPKKYNPK